MDKEFDVVANYKNLLVESPVCALLHMHEEMLSSEQPWNQARKP